MLATFLISGAVAVVPGLCHIPGIHIIDLLKICRGHHKGGTKVDGKETGAKKLEAEIGRPGKPMGQKKTNKKPLKTEKVQKLKKPKRLNLNFNLKIKKRPTRRPWGGKRPTKRPSSSNRREKRRAERERNDKKAVNRLAKRVKNIETSLDRKIWTGVSLRRRVVRLERKLKAMKRKGREVEAKLDHLIGEVGSGSEYVGSRSQTSQAESKSDLTSEVGSGYQDWVYAPSRKGLWSGPDSDVRNTDSNAGQ